METKKFNFEEEKKNDLEFYEKYFKVEVEETEDGDIGSIIFRGKKYSWKNWGSEMKSKLTRIRRYASEVLRKEGMIKIRPLYSNYFLEDWVDNKCGVYT